MTSNTIEITQASLRDIPLIRSLANEIWPSTFGEILSPEQISYMLSMMYSETALKEQMLTRKHQFLIAKSANEPVGYASYELNYNDTETLKIHKIYLLPKTQRKGFGLALMNEIARIGISNNQQKQTLNVNRFNKAFGFYQKIGFKKIATEDIDIGNGFLMEDAIMEKFLF